MTSASTLSKACDEALAIMRSGDVVDAIAKCDLLIAEYPERPEPLRARSIVHAESKDYDSALNDLERLVALNTGEPADYYDLGRIYFRLGSYRAASDALSRCIQAGNDAEFSYYRDAAILLRAESKIRDGDFAGAVEDCELLDSDYSAYVPGMGLCSVKDVRNRAGTR